MKQVLLCFTFFFFAGQVSAQNIEDLLVPPEVLMPQTQEMLRVQRMEMAPNTGRLNLSVPVVDLSDADFDFPISICYNSEGFRPASPDNFVGRDWTLKCGGVITRQVRGMPDDTKRDYRFGGQGPGVYTYGFMDLKNHKHLDPDEIDQDFKFYNGNLWDFSYFTIGTAGSWILPYSGPYIKGTEVEPYADIFHFSFGEYSGKFMFNFDGSVESVTHTGGDCKIDVRRFNQYTGGNNLQQEIRIITDRGYTYCFGGGSGFSAVEYTVTSWVENYTQFDRVLNVSPVNAWYLTKIIAPNGRELTIEYLDDIPLNYHMDRGASHIPNSWIPSHELVRNKGYLNFYLSGFSNRMSSGTPGLINSLGYLRKNLIFTKTALIKTISTDINTVNFHYSAREEYEIPAGETIHEFGRRSGAKLDSVVLRAYNNRIESCKFRYKYEYGYGSSRMFLIDFKSSKHGNYGFNYNSGICSPFSESIDHWGYWRGAELPDACIIPRFSVDNIRLTEYGECDYTFINDTRAPAEAGYDAAILNRITYPTGGSARIEYEQHDYSQRMEFGSNVGYNPRILPYEHTIPEKAGGVRVKLVHHNDGINQEAISTSYEYKDMETGRSSGELLYMQQYVVFGVAKGERQFHWFHSDSRGWLPSEMTREHINYHCVIEKSVEEIRSRSDSSASYIISPLSNERTMQMTFKVGALSETIEDVPASELDNLEREYAEWIFWGINDLNMSGTGAKSSTITIKQGNTVVRHFVFDKEFDQIYTLNPVRDLGPGTYTIVIDAPKDSFARVDTKYPGTGYSIVKGPSKVIKYRPHSYYPDYYNNSYVFPTIPYEVTTHIVYEILPEHGWWCWDYLKRYCRKPYENFEIFRSKLISEEHFTADGTPVLSTNYEYKSLWPGRSRVTFDCKKGSFSPTDGNLFRMFSQLTLESFDKAVLSEKTTTTYADNGSSTTKVVYDYYDNGSLSHETVYDATGGKTTTELFYSAHEPGEVYTKMLSRNNTSAVVRKKMIYEKDGELKIISDRRLNYGFTNGTAGGDFPVVVSLEDISVSPSEIRYEVLKHDNHGNAVHTLTDGERHDIYLWGLKGSRIMAVINNADYNEVSRVLGRAPESLADWQYYQENLDGLRESLPDSHIYTYSYIPGIGVGTMTDPNGRMISYKYDSANRLSQIRRDSPEGLIDILSAYDYHYVNGN